MLSSLIVLTSLLHVECQEYLDVENCDDIEFSVGETVVLKDGLEVTSVKQAERCVKTAEVGDVLKVEYVGRYGGRDGEIFDETKTKVEKSFKFEVGGGRVIQGVDRGVRGMCRGDIRDISVPYKLG